MDNLVAQQNKQAKRINYKLLLISKNN